MKSLLLAILFQSAASMKLTTSLSSRRAAIAGALSMPASSCMAYEEVDPLAAADKIKAEGVLKSTGKPVPPALLGFIAFGGIAAGASFFFDRGTPSSSSSRPALYTEEEQKARFEAYEKDNWVNSVDLPWMPPKKTEAPAGEETEASE